MNAPYDPFREPLTGRMPMICMRCGDRYGTKPCVLSEDGQETHGVCAACQPAVHAEFEAELAALSQAEEPSPGPVFVPAAKVAEICGINEVVLHRDFLPPGWQRDVQWQEIGTVILYAEAYLCDFVGVLSTSGQGLAAYRLMDWLTGPSSAERQIPERLEPLSQRSEAPRLPGSELAGGRTSATPAPRANSEPWFRKGAME